MSSHGRITQAAELFGATGIEVFGAIEPVAPNGFAKLAELDFTGDQVIDASDPGFADLRVWRDDNGDGIGQARELHTLDEVGIQSLDTASMPSTQVIAGVEC